MDDSLYPWFADFSAEHLRHYVGRWKGQPVTFEPFQEQIFREALAVDETGRWLWDQVAIVIPRKNGKTTMLAAYAVWRLVVSDDYPEILLSAASDKNAGRLFNNCAAFIRQSRTLSSLCRVRDHEGEIVREDGMGIIYRLSSDPGKLLGYNPSLVIADEIGEWTTPSLKRVYDTLTTGGGAREGEAQLFTISTAGHSNDREDGILGRLIDSAARSGETEERPGLRVMRNTQARTLVWSYEADTTDRFEVAKIKLANPASWITEDFLLKQAHSDLNDSAFLRYHACVWAETSESFLAPADWRACFLEREVDDGERIVVAFDGSHRRDSTALVGCTLEERPHLFVLGHWENPDPKNREWRVPRSDVEARVAEVMGRFDVAELACDPPGWHREIEEWGDLYSALTAMFPHNRRSLMSEACDRFEAAVKSQGLSHDGNPHLARHLGNAVVKEFPLPGSASGAGRYVTKDHPDSPRKIDLAVAAIVAHYRAGQTQDGDFLYEWKDEVAA